MEALSFILILWGEWNICWWFWRLSLSVCFFVWYPIKSFRIYRKNKNHPKVRHLHFNSFKKKSCFKKFIVLVCLLWVWLFLIGLDYRWYNLRQQKYSRLWFGKKWLSFVKPIYNLRVRVKLTNFPNDCNEIKYLSIIPIKIIILTVI